MRPIVTMFDLHDPGSRNLREFNLTAQSMIVEPRSKVSTGRETIISVIPDHKR
jgi:hypothetical protein